MKFWTWAHKISIDHQIKFPKDPYINANAQVVKVRSRFIAIMDVYNLYARIGEQIFTKILLVVNFYLVTLSLKGGLTHVEVEPVQSK